MSVRINFIQRKSVRERVWKTLNVVVGITTILNVSMVGALVAPQAARAVGTSLSTQILSWNTLGVDSNNPVTDGPHKFLIQARVTNTGGAAATGVFTNFTWGAGTTYLSLVSTATQPLNSIAAGASKDVFYVVQVTPPASPNTPSNDVFDKTRAFTITTTSPDAATSSAGQTLLIEHILSQSRNHILSTFVTPPSPFVGQPFTVHVQYETSSTYLDITPQMTYNPAAVTLESVTTNYVTDGDVQSDIYAQDHGNLVESDFHFRGLAAGTLNFFYTVVDHSGSSFHYNADFSNAIIVPVQPQPALTKSVDKATANPGDAITYTLNYANVGNIDLQNVVITETYSSWFLFSNSTPAPSSGNNVWNIGTLPVGANGSIVIHGTLKSNFPEGGTTVHNVAVMTSKILDFNGQLVSQPPITATADTQVNAACNLVVTKTVDQTNVAGGAVLTYHINYANQGNAFCTGGGVLIYDTIGSGMSYVAGSAKVNSVTNDQDLTPGDPAPEVFPATFNGTSNTLLGNLHEIGPGESGVLELKTQTSTGAACTSWDVQNSGHTDGNEVGSDVTFSSPKTHVTAICNGSLQLTKIVDSGSASASDFSFTISPDPNGVGTVHTSAGASGTYLFNNLPQGQYTITEQSLANYHQVSSTCTTVQVTAGQQATCVVHNARDTGNLKVIKHVINDNGGTAVAANWSLHVKLGGSDVAGSPQNGSEAGTDYSLPTGTYTVGETGGPSGYAASIACDGQATDSVTVTKDSSKVCTITNNDIQPKLTVTKVVINNNGGTKVISDFPLFVGQTSVTSGAQNGFNAGSYTVSETNLPGYVGTISGDCAANGSITLNLGDVKSCTITNDDQPGTLIVKKVLINNNGGNAVVTDFSFKVNNGSSVGFEADAQNDMTVNAGTYSVVENATSGYATTYDNCSQVVIPNGGTATCTITNNDIAPSITLNKVVINDNGGTANIHQFGLMIGGQSVDSGDTLNVMANTPVALNEAGLFGYAFVSLTGDAKCPQALNGTVTLNEGEHITCTITNNDIAPHLTVIKHVINTNGGTLEASDFTMNVDGTNVSDPSFPGAEAPGVTVTLNQGGYVVSENPVAGYSPVYSSDCTGSIAVGESKTCTVTNTAIAPHLIVIKHVINNNGGTSVAGDFTMSINGITVPLGNSFAGQEAPGSDKIVMPGTYTVSENGPSGYAASYSADCSGTIALGETKVCTVTNDDVAPSLTLVKQVSNTHNGNAQATDWTLTATGPTPISGQGGAVSDATFSAGTYGLSESAGPSGYTAGNWVCLGGSQNGATITVATGETATCTIINSDQPAHVTLIKHVINDNGGTADVNDFGLSIGGTSVDSGQTLDVDSNTSYALNEVGKTGYAFVSFTGAGCPSELGGTVNLNEGASITCTITNDDIAPTITLNKVVINNNGGTAGVNEFGLTIGDTSVISGQTLAVNAHQAYALNEAGKTGYSFVSITGDETCPEVLDGTVTLSEGQNISCTITNDDIAPQLTVIKHVINNDGGVKVAGDFTMNVAGTNASPSSFAGSENGTQATVDQGAYNVTENQLPGYAASFSADCAGTINVGETKTCTITNDDIVSTIGLVKTATPTIVAAGGNITYSLAWSVTGVNHVTNAMVTDPLPANTTFVSADCGTTTGTCTVDHTTSTISWSLGTREAGETGTVTLVVATVSPIANGTVITNTGTFDTTETPPVTSTANTPVSSAPILSITKANDVIGFTNPGKQVTYTVTVSNALTASDTAHNVVITDTLPAGFTFADTGLATKSTAAGDLAPGVTKVFTYLVNISAAQLAGTYTNTASAKGDNTTTVTATSPVEVRVPSVLGITAVPTLVLTKKVNPTVTNPGKTVTYTVTISNPGDVDLTNVHLSDKLPAGLTFADTGLGTKNWDLGTLKAHHQRVIDYAVNVSASIKAGSYENLATVTSTELGPQTAKAAVEIKVPQVLGLATTGVSLRDYVIFSLGFGLMLLGFYWVARLRRQANEVEPA